MAGPSYFGGATGPGGPDAGEGDYRLLANELPLVVWTCDVEGRLTWVNDRWTELTGMQRDESLRDKRALAAVHPDDREEMQQRFARALADGSPGELEYRVRAKEGDYRRHLARVAPVRDGEGQICGWVASALDVHDRLQAGEALRASERRFETVFNLNPQATVINRLYDGCYLSVNDAFLKMTGYAREEVVGKNSVELGVWTEAEREAIVAAVMRDPAAGLDAPYRTKDGRPLTLELVSAPIDFGGERCFITVATDVTERRATEVALRCSEARARARADELTALMEAVPAVVFIAEDPDCRQVRGNRTARTTLRIAEGKNLSKTALDPAPSNHFEVLVSGAAVPPQELPLQRAARGVEVSHHEEEVRFADGEVVHLYGGAVPLRDPSGAPRGAIGAFVDVTRLKQAEAALREADRQKDEFLALLSHELRNPLAPILTAAQLMELRGDVATPHEREVILRQAEHLVRLVDDLLDVARVARGKITLTRRPIELGRVVAKAVEATAPLLEQRWHRLEISVAGEGLSVDVDEVRLTQVVSNLLTNAARYTDRGGHIAVTARRAAGAVVLEVRDDGRGIDPALLPRVFDRFVQGEGTADRPPGLGLGLALVRTFTELHGGTVTAHSDGAGRGSTFTVRLPAAAAPTPTPARRGGQAVPLRRPAGSGKRVLVVDDNRDAARMICDLLAVAGHEVQVAGDATQALSAAGLFGPEVAILDIGLPVMDGYALGRELRARLGTATPVLIALTGYGQEQDQRRSAEAGFSYHLVKPVDAERLIRLVDTVGARAV
jgi:PAS domain S-box-containing protein